MTVSRTRPTAADLAQLLDRRSLRRLAGAKSFDRGTEYFADGRVRALTTHEASLAATVRGSQTYTAKLWLSHGEIDYACTCRFGADGEFCKHVVAAGLAWLEGRLSPAPVPSTAPAGSPRSRGVKRSKRRGAEVTMDDVREYLTKEPTGALVDMIIGEASENAHLRRRLLARAAKGTSRGLALDEYREAIDGATDPGDFVDWREMHSYSRGIEEVIQSVAELLRDGYPDEVIELTEHALLRVEESIERVDDSDGSMGMILETLRALHLAACRKARPDPEVLARRLFDRELHGEWDTFSGAAESYASVLGERGLEVYRRLAEAEWAKVPKLGPKDRHTGSNGERFRITQIMESLARQAGDVDSLVAVKQRDLSSAYDYLEIAGSYRDAGRHDLALEWAERGVKAFPDRTDSRLREFLADEYHRRRRHGDAMAIVWSRFAESPQLEEYRLLKKHADRTKGWAKWRPKALACVRESIAKAKAGSAHRAGHWATRADQSDLVRILLWERKVEDAWAEAIAGGCIESLWMELAAKRGKRHPADSLPIYQRQIEPTLRQKDNRAYRAAIGLLREVRRLMVRLGQASDFGPYLATIRAGHKAKRNFVKLLEHARWD
jgi:tetratricopeptide (TPR) repeat protein